MVLSMTGTLREELDGVIARGLAEDVGTGDVTTEWTVPPDAEGRARIVAKQRVVLAGVDVVPALFSQLDDRVDVELLGADGDRVMRGQVIARLEGPARPILTGERVALNILGRLSGIATMTRRFVEEVRGTSARIIDTRKTTPGWRRLEKAAVVSGGGGNHRMGLYDMVMIKDNHIAVAGGIEAAVARVRRENEGGLPIEVEVRTLPELEEVLPLGVDWVMLDNMAPASLRHAVARVRAFPGPKPKLEASGNITLENVRTVAQTGVDVISVGTLTHSAPIADLSMQVET